MDTTDTSLSYKSWKYLVDRDIMRLVGMWAEDLTDQPYRDWYEAGTTPRDAALEALANNGYDPDHALDHPAFLLDD